MTTSTQAAEDQAAESSLYGRIRHLRLTHGLENLAISYYDYETSVGWSYNADTWFHAASTMKIAVMAALFRAIPDKNFGLDDELHVRNQFSSIVDGSPYQLSVSESSDAVATFIGESLTIRELIHHMITTSSNLATNLLVELVGVREIQKTLDDLGIEGLRVLRGVEDQKAFDQGISNQATANGLTALLRAILMSNLFVPDASRQMLDILQDQKYRCGIPAGLPDTARVAHKTGNISTVHHDAGVVFFEDREPYVLSVLTEFEQGRKSKRAIAEVTAHIHESLGGKPE